MGLQNQVPDIPKGKEREGIKARRQIISESTYAFTQLTEILQKARYVESLTPKMRDQNQKIFSKLVLLRWKNNRVLVGHQKSTGDIMLYYIGGGPKK